MTKEERTAYIKTLKVGDSACYELPRAFGGRRDIRVVFVVKITPKGMIRVSDDTLFNTHGRSTYGDRHVFLEPYTPKVEEDVAREKLINTANHSAFVLDSNKVDLSKVPSNLLQELVNLETRISLSLTEPAKAPEPPKKLCSCGREATRVFSDTQSGIESSVCYDCYDIESCQDKGYAETGESYSKSEAIEILEMGGWKSAYD